ncbi:RDD family protein [Niallia circulans]
MLHSSKWQATIGKKLLGLKVEDLKGNKLSFWRSLGRYIVSSLLSGILLIGFILAAFTEKKQALHDLIVGSIVVKNNS